MKTSLVGAVPQTILSQEVKALAQVSYLTTPDAMLSLSYQDVVIIVIIIPS